MRSVIIGSSILLAASASSAFANNNEFTIGTTNRSLRTASANAVTSENLGGVQLGVARQIHLGLVSNLQIWGTLGFASTSAEGELFGMPTEVDTFDVAFGATARYVLHRHVAVAASLDLGPSRSSLAIEGDHNKRVADSAWGVTATGALGVDLLLLAYPRFSLGARFEMGYTTHSPAALSPADGASEDMLVLSEAQASIGHLDLGGRFYAFSLLSQF